MLTGQNIDDALPIDKNGHAIYPPTRQLVTGIEARLEGLSRRAVCRGLTNEATVFALTGGSVQQAEHDEEEDDEGEEEDEDLARSEITTSSGQRGGAGGRSRLQGKFPGAGSIRSSGSLGSRRGLLSDGEEEEDNDANDDDNIAISDDDDDDRYDDEKKGEKEEDGGYAAGPLLTKEERPNTVEAVSSFIPLENKMTPSEPTARSIVSPSTPAPATPPSLSTSITATLLHEHESTETTGSNEAYRNEDEVEKAKLAEQMLLKVQELEREGQRKLVQQQREEQQQREYHYQQELLRKEAEMLAILKAKNEEECEKARVALEGRRMAFALQSLRHRERRSKAYCLSSWQQLVYCIQNERRVQALAVRWMMWKRAFLRKQRRREVFQQDICSIKIRASSMGNDCSRVEAIVPSITMMGRPRAPQLQSSPKPLSNMLQKLKLHKHALHLPSIIGPILQKGLQCTFPRENNHNNGVPSFPLLWKCALFSSSPHSNLWSPDDAVAVSIMRSLLLHHPQKSLIALYDETFSSYPSPTSTLVCRHSKQRIRISVADICRSAQDEESIGVIIQGSQAVILIIEVNRERGFSLNPLKSYLSSYQCSTRPPLVLIVVEELFDQEEKSSTWQQIPLASEINSSVDEKLISGTRWMEQIMGHLSSHARIGLHAAYFVQSSRCSDGFDLEVPFISQSLLEVCSSCLHAALSMAAEVSSSSSPLYPLVAKLQPLFELETEVNDFTWNIYENEGKAQEKELQGLVDGINGIICAFISRLRRNIEAEDPLPLPVEFASVSKPFQSDLWVPEALFRNYTGDGSSSLPVHWFNKELIVKCISELGTLILPSSSSSSPYAHKLLVQNGKIPPRLLHQVENLLVRGQYRRAVSLLLNYRLHALPWVDMSLFLRYEDLEATAERENFVALSSSGSIGAMAKTRETEVGTKRSRVSAEPISMPFADMDKALRGNGEVKIVDDILDILKKGSLKRARDGLAGELLELVEEERSNQAKLESDLALTLRPYEPIPMAAGIGFKFSGDSEKVPSLEVLLANCEKERHRGELLLASLSSF